MTQLHRGLSEMTWSTRRGSYRSSAILAAAVLAIGGCGVLPKGETNLDVSAKDRGIASWYGEDFHGKVAADGRPFDMHAFTGAHRSLPLGSVVRVVNVQNGRVVHLRITDRGPYIPGRILDVSRAAAIRLGMLGQGLAPVLVDVVGDAGLVKQWKANELEPTSASTREARHRTMSIGGGSPPVHHAQSTRQRDDVLRLRRLRRVSDVLAASHHVDRCVATLIMS